MFTRLEITQMAHALASHASARQSVIARNVVNADTPGYRAAEVEDFASYYRRWQGAAARPGPIGASAGSRPELKLAETVSVLSPNGNSVSLEDQMVRAVEVRHQHDLALSVYRSVSGIVRSTLGR